MTFLHPSGGYVEVVGLNEDLLGELKHRLSKLGFKVVVEVVDEVPAPKRRKRRAKKVEE